jgi:hypothetical protein
MGWHPPRRVRFGHAKRGTVLKSSLSNEAQQELQDALHGERPGQ